jgi:hypothetical protein
MAESDDGAGHRLTVEFLLLFLGALVSGVVGGLVDGAPVIVPWGLFSVAIGGILAVEAHRRGKIRRRIAIGTGIAGVLFLTSLVIAAAVARDPDGVGTVQGCNTFGRECDGNPVYKSVPTVYDPGSMPRVVARIDSGANLQASCWVQGARITNWASESDPPDPGPDPYQSDIHFRVLTPNGWGYLADTHFVRDKVGKLGLPMCE